MISTSRLTRVTKGDWALAAIGLGFTLAGLLLLRTDFNTGVITLAVFGLCLAHAVHVILRKRRLARLQAITAIVEGGRPMRPSRAQFALYGGALLALGATLATFSPPSSAEMNGGGWLLMLVGGGMLGGLAVGWLPIGLLQFDPDGLTIGDWGGQVLVPWDAITGLGCNEVHGNPAVLLTVDEHALVTTPARYRSRLAHQMTWWRHRAGVDFVIFSHNYGIAAPVLLAALERYAGEPAARQQLQRRPQLRG